MQSFNKKASGTLRFSVSPAKSTFFINTYLRPFAAAYPEICFQFREEAVSAQTRHIAETAVILPLPMRRCRHRSCLPPTKRRKNIFMPFTVRRQTAALIHSSR